MLSLSYVIAALGLTMMSPLSSFGMVLVGTALRSVGGGTGWVFSTQLLLQLVPNHVRGRVFSTEFALFTLMNAVGTAFGGWALDATAIEVSNIMWLTAFFILVPGALWTLLIVAAQRVDRIAADTGS